MYSSFLCVVAMLHSFNQDCKSVGCEVSFVLTVFFCSSNQEALKNPYKIKMSFLVLRLLDRNQSLDTSSLILNDSIDQSKCILCQLLVRVDLVHNGE